MNDSSSRTEPSHVSRKFKFGGMHLHMHPTVFGVSTAIIIGVVFLTLLNLDTSEAVFLAIKQWITEYFGWLLILCVQGFLVFCIFLALSRFGQIRIGGPGARPQFSRPTWFAMLFSAGMGIGLLFYGVAEPVIHFHNPPKMAGGTADAATRAMDLTFLHWGFHAWAIYAIVALSLAYFSYNRGLPLTIRSAFYPLLGKRIYGPAGTVIDVLAVVATLFGVATSLGFGVTQINSGLGFLFGVPVSAQVQVLLILGITLVATASVISGLNHGIRRLSELNLVAAVILLLFLLIGGPTLFLLKSTVQNTGHYLQNLMLLGSWTETYGMESEWQGNWTLFYWTWWIAWSPFVGMFIARISKGRTIREFLGGVLLVPAVLSFLWFSVFGGAAIFAELYEGANVAAAVNDNMATALFKLLELYPFTSITTFIAILLVFVFFVTSSDSGSLVIDIITAGGNLNPPVAQRIYWALTEGVVAAVLLAGGGLLALQTAAITTGLPFALVLVAMCFGLYRALSQDLPVRAHPPPRQPDSG
ncbi:BCCT family transporter [Elongatibacter sediminis]|uniref:BCCT family transporter n=1 Tax=Elongatibacter sediminis TaxID=3119006 RepID=A0AAW9RJD7_9GAMM